MVVPDLIPYIGALLPLGTLLAVGTGFVVGHLTSHRRERIERTRLAAEYETLAGQCEALAHRMAADDRMRAGIDIGVDHVITCLESYLSEMREEREASRVGMDR